MKTLKTILAVSTLSLMFSSCFLDDDCGFGSDRVENRIIEVSNFTGITLDIDADVLLRNGTEQSVEIEAQSDVIDDITTTVVDGIWEIDLDKCLLHHEDIKIFITTPTLSSIELDSGGSITSSDVHKTNLPVQINLLSSGDIVYKIEGTEVDVNIDGSGELILSGSLDKLDIDLDDSGIINSYDCITKNVKIVLWESGDAFLYASETLYGTLNGSGNIHYRGGAEEDITITGSGRVLKED